MREIIFVYVPNQKEQIDGGDPSVRLFEIVLSRFALNLFPFSPLKHTKRSTVKWANERGKVKLIF